jgi:hypothetical protein
MNDGSSSPEALMTVRDLDLLTYQEKIDHWMGEQPWSPSGVSVRFKQAPTVFKVSTDGDGNITRMPLLIGRPCFGIISAFLRFKDRSKFVRGRGMLPDSRCAACNARIQCEKIIISRIKALPLLRQIYDEWLKADGPMIFMKSDGEGTRARTLLRRLCMVARSTPFTSVNDTVVASHYLEEDQIRLEKDRDRKAKERRKNQRSGILDERHTDDLKEAADRRRLIIIGASLGPNPVSGFKNLPQDSIWDMMEVWHGRETLKAEHTNHNAPSIARWIIANGMRNNCKNYASLATRVAKDLDRIFRFEKIDGLLPAFDPAKEFSL